MRRLAVAFALCLPIVAACDKSSPVAPEGTVLTISANPVTIPTNGTSTITVTGRKPNGLPITEGTLVRFSTTIGQIEESVPANAEGVARATLRGDGRAGKATVKATTGAVEGVEAEIDIGSPASSITLQTSATNIPEIGGELSLQAAVRDPQAQPQPNAQVQFSSPVGQLASGGAFVVTDAGGIARDTLTVTEADLAGYSGSKFEVKAEAGAADGGVKEAKQEITIGTPAGSIQLAAEPTTLPQTGGNAALRATVLSTAGRPVVGGRVFFTAEIGRLDSDSRARFTNDNGEAFDTLRVSSTEVSQLADGQLTVKAQVAGTDGTLREATTDLRVGALAGSITVQASPSTISDTGGELTLVATVRSSSGALLSGAAVTFGAEIGSLASGSRVVFTGADGQVSDTLTVTEPEILALTGDRFVAEALSGTQRDTVEIRIISLKPIASFNALRVNDDTVFFENTTTGQEPISYQWDFQNDNIVDSTLKSPTFDYGSTGQFTVRLTATNAIDTDTEFKTITLPLP